MLARLIRELKDSERELAALQAHVLGQLRGFRNIEHGILPAINGQGSDLDVIQVARRHAESLADRSVVIDELRQMEETHARISEIKRAVDKMTG